MENDWKFLRIPTTSRVGILLVAGFTVFREYEAAARALKVQLQSLDVRAPNPDLEGVFRDAVKGRVGALIAPRPLVGYRSRLPTSLSRTGCL
jgi:hypothetical protein